MHRRRQPGERDELLDLLLGRLGEVVHVPHDRLVAVPVPLDSVQPLGVLVLVGVYVLGRGDDGFTSGVAPSSSTRWPTISVAPPRPWIEPSTKSARGDAAFAKLWAQIDTDNSGTIQPQEFIAYCSGGAAVAVDQSGSAAAIKKEALRAIPPEDEEELSLTDSEAEGGGEEAE